MIWKAYATMCCGGELKPARKAMAGFKKDKLANQPSISSEYVKYLAFNSGNDHVEKLTTCVSALEATVKTHGDELTKANSTAGIAQNRITGGKQCSQQHAYKV